MRSLLSLSLCMRFSYQFQGVATLFTTKNGGRVERLQSSNLGHGVADYTIDNPAASPRVVTGGNEF